MTFRIRVENFQSIESAEIVVEGFTVITGTNNLGKSAMVRALKGVFTNPAPSFVRKGATHAVVELWSGPNYVRWEKGKNRNSYFLKTEDGEYTYDKPGTKTPEKVCQAFGVLPVTVGTKTVWPQFADQLTGAVFLLDLPGSALADVVANVERIQVLNKALKKADSQKRKAVSALKLRRADQCKLDEKLFTFENLDKALEDVAALETLRTKTDRLRQGHEKILGLRKSFVEAKGAVAALEGFTEVRVPSDALEEEIREAKTELGDLSKLRVALTRAQEQLSALEGLEEAESVLPDGAAEKAVEKLKGGIRTLTALQESYHPAKVNSDRWINASKASEEIRLEEDHQQMATKIQRALTLLRGVRNERAKSAEQFETYSEDLRSKQESLHKLEHDLGTALSEHEQCPLCDSQLGT